MTDTYTCMQCKGVTGYAELCGTCKSKVEANLTPTPDTDVAAFRYDEICRSEGHPPRNAWVHLTDEAMGNWRRRYMVTKGDNMVTTTDGQNWQANACTTACPSGCDGYHYTRYNLDEQLRAANPVTVPSFIFSDPSPDYTADIYEGAIRLVTGGVCTLEDAVPMADALLRDSHAMALNFHNAQEEIEDEDCNDS